MVDALNSEYMAALHQGRELPQEEKHFSFGFEKPDISQEELREYVAAQGGNVVSLPGDALVSGQGVVPGGWVGPGLAFPKPRT